MLWGLAGTSGVSAAPVKAVSWNIEWYPGGRPEASNAERRAHAVLVTRQLVKMSPEIFLAQEVTDERAFQKLVGEVAGMKMDIFSRFPDRDVPARQGPQQCAIASTLKVREAFFEVFKPVANVPSLTRGFAFAALEHPAGGLIMVYSVHLKSNRGSETAVGERDVADARIESARQLIAHRAEMEKRFAGERVMGWLIGGDFNTNHDGQFPRCTAIANLVAAGFHNSWDGTPKGERLTWRVGPDERRFQPTTFDYLMTAGFKERQAKLYGGVSLEASDHAPVGILLEGK